MDFLSRELRRFHSVLYSDCFNKLLADFWSEVVKVSTLSSLNFSHSDSSLRVFGRLQGSLLQKHRVD